jgi:hypothetical protein
MCDAEIADGKENKQQQDDTVGESSSAQPPIDPEIEAEAYENYSFDRMIVYDDGDAAHLLVDFRASLQVVPDEDHHVQGNMYAPTVRASRVSSVVPYFLR